MKRLSSSTSDSVLKSSCGKGEVTPSNKSTACDQKVENCKKGNISSSSSSSEVDSVSYRLGRVDISSNDDVEKVSIPDEIKQILRQKKIVRSACSQCLSLVDYLE